MRMPENPALSRLARDPLVRAFRVNPTLFIGALVTSLIALKILWAARLEPQTALALLQGTGPQLALSVVVLLAPYLAALAAGIAALAVWYHFRQGEVLPGVLLIAVVLAALAILLIPVFVYVVVVLNLIFEVFRRWAERRIFATDRGSRWKAKLDEADADPRTTDVQLSLSLAVLVVLAALLPEMWLPTERVTTNELQEVVGYVVSSDGTWTIVLLEAPRTVRYYKTVDVVARQLCRNDRYSGLARSLPQLLLPEPGDLVECFEPSVGPGDE